MVDAIGPTSAGRIGGVAGAQGVARVSRTGLVARGAASGQVPNPAADLAAYGPPVDVAKVAELRKAIASGSYKPNPAAIADKMIALDLPPADTGNAAGKDGSRTGK